MTETTQRTTPRYIPAWDLPTDGDFNHLAHVYHWGTKALQDFEAENRSIRHRVDLSQVGMNTAVQAAAAKYLSGSAEKRETVNREREGLERAQRAMELAGLKAESEVGTALRAGEVRTWFRSLDGSQRLAALRVALESDDRETMSAILAAPRAFALLDDQFRERLEAVLSERASPVEFERIKQTGRAIALATEALDVTEQYIRSEAVLNSTTEERIHGLKSHGDATGLAGTVSFAG